MECKLCGNEIGKEEEAGDYDLKNLACLCTECFNMRMKCDCGSGKMKQEQLDAMGIFLCYTCPSCQRRKLSKFDDCVFDRAAYRQRAAETGEAIEPDEG